MDVEIPVLAGYLNVPTQTGFSLNRISKKKTCSRYCLLFKSSRHGIERLEICENKDDKNPKIFTLENCVKITQEPSPANMIQIVKKNGTLTLNTLTDEDLKEWVNALQTVAFCDNSGAHSAHGAIEEDNDLYCSSFDGQFIITLIPSEASIRCNIEPKAYMLQMTATELQLKSVEDLNAIVAMWPYRFIRKYGYRDGKFTFEAGRKCTTGEGVFTLDHTNPQEVFRCMSAKMKSMKKLISGDSLSSIDCVENQFSAAASMEPGSRSPLPPSPSNQHSGEFEMNSTQSCISLRGFISSNDSLNNFSSSFINTSANNSVNGPVLFPVKHVPNKPPRKLPTPMDKLSNVTQTLCASNIGVGVGVAGASVGQLHCDKFKKMMNYEPVAITTSSIEHNKNSGSGSTVLLKPPSPESLRSTITANSLNCPPDLPLRNESAKMFVERDYECIETITDAWKTLGVSDINHCERNATHLCENESHLVWQRSLSQRDKRHKDTTNTTPKIIDIDIGEGSGSSISCPSTASADVTYDRLDFLSPNNKTSSGYKTIVTVTSPGTRSRCSPPLPNEYELIASPDTEICRKADDSHLGYGVLRKAANVSGTTSLPLLKSNHSANNNNNIITNNAAAIIHTSNSSSSLNNNNGDDLMLPANITTTRTPTTPTPNASVIASTTTATQLSTNKNNEVSDHRSLNYTIVSKPKRV